MKLHHYEPSYEPTGRYKRTPVYRNEWYSHITEPREILDVRHKFIIEHESWAVKFFARNPEEFRIGYEEAITNLNAALVQAGIAEVPPEQVRQLRWLWG